MDEIVSPWCLSTVNSRLTVNNSIDFNPFLTVNVQYKHREQSSKPLKNRP
jgi:hypothetical protein